MARSIHNSRHCVGCNGLIPRKTKKTACSQRCNVAVRSARGKDRMPKHAPGSLR